MWGLVIRFLMRVVASKFVQGAILGGGVAGVVTNIREEFQAEYNVDDDIADELEDIGDWLAEGIADGTIMLPNNWNIDENGIPDYLHVNLKKGQCWLTDRYYSGTFIKGMRKNFKQKVTDVRQSARIRK
jgi:hypothetical protein